MESHMNGTTERKRHHLHKSMIITLKLLPMVMAFSFIMNVYCAFVGVGFQVVTHYAGLVIAPLAFMYIASYVHHFCNYHRVFIHYIAVVELLNITDWYFKIPISNEAICIVHFVITAVFLVTAFVMYIKKFGKRCKEDCESISK